MRTPLAGQRVPGPGAGPAVVEPALHQKELNQRQLGGPRALLVKATTNTTCVINLPPAPCRPLPHFLELGYTPAGPCPGQGQGPTRKEKKWIPGPGNPLVAQMVKNLPTKAEDLGSIPGSGTTPGDGHGNPLQHSCLENPMDRGVWQATVHEVTESWTRLTDQTTSPAWAWIPWSLRPTPKTTQARGSSYVLRLRTRREGPQKSRWEGGQEPASSCPSWLRTSLLKFIRKTHFFLNTGVYTCSLSHCWEGLPHLSRHLWAHTLDGGRARAQFSSTQNPDRHPGHVSTLNQPMDFQPEGREADVRAEPRRAPRDLDRFA